MFSVHGEVVSVRLVTMKSGKSKGMAYVEFATEEQAKKAMLQTDGAVVGENKIEVAISNTPARKADGEGSGDGSVGTTSSSTAVASLSGAANMTAAAATSSADSAPAPHLGGGKKETVERGKARTQISLVPRAAMKPASGIMMPRSLKAKVAAKPAAKPAAVEGAAAAASTADTVASIPEVKDEERMEREMKESAVEEPKKSNDDFRKLFFK